MIKINKVRINIYFLFALFLGSILYPKKTLAYEFNLPPSHVVVPSVDVSLPIDTVPVSVDTWQVSLYGASFGDHTSMPGEKGGNTVIFAHAMPNLFGSLPNIKVGDEIHIFTNHDWLVYKTTEILVLEPTDVEVLKPNNNHDLTLYTCVGPNYSQRFVAKAKLVPAIF